MRVVMRVDKAGNDEPVGRVDDLGAVWRGQADSDLSDVLPFDQNILDRRNMRIGIGGHHPAAFDQNCCVTHRVLLYSHRASIARISKTKNGGTE